MVRTLRLRREQLTELTTADLGGVVAGAPPAETSDCPDHTYYCITGWALCGSSKLLCS